MTLIKLLYIPLFVFCYIQSFAQSTSGLADVKIEASRKSNPKAEKAMALGKIGDAVFSIKVGKRYNPSEIVIEKLDGELKFMNAAEMKFKEGKRKKIFEGGVIFNDKIYVFTSYESLGLNRDKTFYAQTINADNLQLNDDLVKIGNLKIKSVGGLIVSNFYYILSPDQSKILCYYDKPSASSDREAYSCKVYDESFKKLYSETISLSSRSMSESIKLDNQGDIVLIAKDFKKKIIEQRAGEVEFTYSLTSVSDLGESKEEISIAAEGKSIINAGLSVEEDGIFNVYGVYSNSNTFIADGTFFFRIDKKSREVIAKAFKDFDANLISQNVIDQNYNDNSKKKGERRSVDNYSYLFGGATKLNDESTLYTMEQFSDPVIASTASEKYYNHDILISKLSKDNTIEWIKNIPKRQVSYDATVKYSSYHTSMKDDKLILIYNDHPDNSGVLDARKVNEVFLGKNRTQLTIASVDTDGNIVKEGLLSTDVGDTNIIPKEVPSLGNGQYLFLNSTGNMQSHGLIQVSLK